MESTATALIQTHRLSLIIVARASSNSRRITALPQIRKFRPDTQSLVFRFAPRCVQHWSASHSRDSNRIAQATETWGLIARAQVRLPREHLPAPHVRRPGCNQRPSSACPLTPSKPPTTPGNTTTTGPHHNTTTPHTQKPQTQPPPTPGAPPQVHHSLNRPRPPARGGGQPATHQPQVGAGSTPLTPAAPPPPPPSRLHPPAPSTSCSPPPPPTPDPTSPPSPPPSTAHPSPPTGGLAGGGASGLLTQPPPHPQPHIPPGPAPCARTLPYAPKTKKHPWVGGVRTGTGGRPILSPTPTPKTTHWQNPSQAALYNGKKADLGARTLDLFGWDCRVRRGLSTRPPMLAASQRSGESFIAPLLPSLALRSGKNFFLRAGIRLTTILCRGFPYRVIGVTRHRKGRFSRIRVWKIR